MRLQGHGNSDCSLSYQTGNGKDGYRKGSILHSEKPFIYILNNKLRTERCDFCFKGTHLMRCSCCLYAYYCDRECQKKAWSLHKGECMNLKRIAPKVVPDAARLLARIIIKLKKGGAHERGFYTASSFRVFKDLMSHYAEIKEDPQRIEHFTSLAAVIREFLKDETLPNAVEFLGMYGRMIVNGFSILDDEMQGVGTGIYLGASVIDHSCVPNAVAVFEGTTLYIRTLKDLKTLDWTKVFISYVDLLNTAASRQKDLQATYYFLCQCERCLDREEYKLMTSTICQNHECKHCILGGASVADVQCNNCGEMVSSETWEEITEISNFTDQQLQSMRDVAYLDVCRMCLSKQKGLFHHMNLQQVKVLDLAMESCIAMSNWESALEFGRQLVEPFRKYYGELHPLRAIHLFKLGKIAILLDHLEDARNWLTEAGSILRITHGEQHPLYKNDLHQYIRQCQISY